MLRRLINFEKCGPRQIIVVTDFLSDKDVHFQLSWGKQAPALYQSIANDSHASIATSLHENMPLSSTVHQLSGLPTCLLLLRTLKITVGVGASWCRLECVLVCVGVVSCVWCVYCVCCWCVCVGVCVGVVSCVWCVVSSVCVWCVCGAARCKPPCVDSKRLCAGKTPVSHETRAFWRHTRRRFESTHGGVLNLQKLAHTNTALNGTHMLTQTSLNHHPWHTNHQQWATSPFLFFQHQCLHNKRMHVKLSPQTQHTHPQHTTHTVRRTDRERRTDTDRPTDRQRDKWSGVSVIVREGVSS